MRIPLPAVSLACACMLWAGPARAWWEATLRQVDVVVAVTPDGQGRVTYELRHHVDRGRFEGLTIQDPGAPLEWDRTACYIEDARGQRYPARVMRRHRDEAYLVRIARPPGLRRGWVTVSLTHAADLHDCCLRTDGEGRTLLSWTALGWDVGMDRMTVTLRLDPEGGALEPDEASEAEHEVEPSTGGLFFQRIRPVRWYEMRIGAYLPEGFLERPARAEANEDEDPEESEPAAIPPPPGEAGVGPAGVLGRLWIAFVALGALLLLAVKWRAGGAGHRGRAGVPEPLLLPRLPGALRWLFVAACLGAGAWLQAAPFLAAGTLAIAAGVLLAVRGPGARPAPTEEARAWWPCEREVLHEIVAEERRRGPRLWPRFLDGTSLVGLPLFAASVLLALGALRALSSQADTTLWDAVAIDLALLLGAAFLTGRRRDLPPSPGAGSALVLGRAFRSIRRAAQAAGSDLRVLVGAVEAGGATCDIRLSFAPPPPGTSRVEVAVRPREGALGWLGRPVAQVHQRDGEVVSLVARSGFGLAWKLRRRLREASRADER